jgi:hypothetical protein
MQDLLPSIVIVLTGCIPETKWLPFYLFTRLNSSRWSVAWGTAVLAPTLACQLGWSWIVVPKQADAGKISPKTH